MQRQIEWWLSQYRCAAGAGSRRVSCSNYMWRHPRPARRDLFRRTRSVRVCGRVVWHAALACVRRVIRGRAITRARPRKSAPRPRPSAASSLRSMPLWTRTSSVTVHCCNVSLMRLLLTYTDLSKAYTVNSVMCSWNGFVRNHSARECCAIHWHRACACACARRRALSAAQRVICK